MELYFNEYGGNASHSIYDHENSKEEVALCYLYVALVLRFSRYVFNSNRILPSSI